MTKKSIGQVAPKMEVKTGNTDESKKLANGPVKTPKEKPSYEDLLKRLEELEKIRSNKPQSIDEVINFFEQKKAKINLLEGLKLHKENLTSAEAKAEEAINNKDFDGQKYKLAFFPDSRYNSDALFNITNPEIIKDCASFLIMKISQKIKLLESEIQQDF